MVKHLKIFSGTVGPISLERRIKVCINGPSHMTKMVALPIYCKNLKNLFFSGRGGLISTKVGMKHLGLEVKGIFTLTNMTLAEDHLPKTKSQLSVVKTFGPLVLNHLRKI